MSFCDKYTAACPGERIYKIHQYFDEVMKLNSLTFFGPQFMFTDIIFTDTSCIDSEIGMPGFPRLLESPRFFL